MKFNIDSKIYISTTKDFNNVAKVYADKDGYRVVRIDVDKLPDTVKIYDLTVEANRNKYLNNNWAKCFAKGSEEVVIEGYIPPEAIELDYQP